MKNRLIGLLLCLLAFVLVANAQQISFVKNCSWEDLKACSKRG